MARTPEHEARSTTRAADITQRYMRALGTGDLVGARALLHDNLSFRGPIDTFDWPEPLLKALKKLQAIVDRIDVQKVFADGDDVCALYHMVTKTPAGAAFIAEWYHVTGDKIDKIRVVFDTKPFAGMFAR